MAPMADTTADPRAPSPVSFLSACLAGTARPDDVDDWVDAWHESDTALTLAEYLGFTTDEYAAWFRNPNALTAILASAQAIGPSAGLVPATAAAPTVAGSPAPACGCPDGECHEVGRINCYFSSTQNLEGPAR